MLRTFLLIAVAAAVAGCGYPRVARVPTVEKLSLARVPGAPGTISVTAVGSVPADGWSNVRLKRLYEPNHPPGILAFELVAQSPHKRRTPIDEVRQVSATTQVALPPGTRLIYVMGGVNDEAKAVPGTGAKRRGRTSRRSSRRPFRQPRRN